MNNSNNNRLSVLILTLVIGLILGYVLNSIFIGKSANIKSSNNDTFDQEKPLYWVAPMDSNYRRDEPGQSPMGMDLVPFYGDKKTAVSEAGLIEISPTVVNNLGVRTAEVSMQDVKADFKSVGVVQYNEEQLIHIHSRVEGWVEKLYLRTIGDPVVKGQLMYEIYAPELVNAQEELLLAMTRNNQRLIKASEARLLSLEFTQQQIFKLKTSKNVQQRVSFFAPQSGVVVDLKIRTGYFVKPSDTLISIGTLADIWVEVDVLERQVDRLQPNQTVIMTSDFMPARKWHGKVEYVYPTLDSMTRTLKIRLQFPNEDKALKPNMFTHVTFKGKGTSKQLMVPAEAVIRTGSSNRVVKVLGEGQYKSIQVKLGNHYVNKIEIIDGLNVGDKVVTSAQFLLDSESSQSASFERISDREETANEKNHSEMDHDEMNHSEMDQEPSNVEQLQEPNQ